VCHQCVALPISIQISEVKVAGFGIANDPPLLIIPIIIAIPVVEHVKEATASEEGSVKGRVASEGPQSVQAAGPAQRHVQQMTTLDHASPHQQQECCSEQGGLEVVGRAASCEHHFFLFYPHVVPLHVANPVSTAVRSLRNPPSSDGGGGKYRLSIVVKGLRFRDESASGSIVADAAERRSRCSARVW
jgi:hypothetical protein